MFEIFEHSIKSERFPRTGCVIVKWFFYVHIYKTKIVNHEKIHLIDIAYNLGFVERFSSFRPQMTLSQNI